MRSGKRGKGGMDARHAWWPACPPPPAPLLNTEHDRHAPPPPPHPPPPCRLCCGQVQLRRDAAGGAQGGGGRSPVQQGGAWLQEAACRGWRCAWSLASRWLPPRLPGPTRRSVRSAATAGSRAGSSRCRQTQVRQRSRAGAGARASKGCPCRPAVRRPPGCCSGPRRRTPRVWLAGVVSCRNVRFPALSPPTRHPSR